MKIYFAGSIRAGRGDAELYHRIIEFMKRHHTVLTEHIGDQNLQESITDKQIYEQDTTWLREADILIAECTNPSLGMGYELAYAETHRIPCHVFYNTTRTHLSAMLTGDDYFIIHPYEMEEDLYSVLDEVLQ